MTKKKEAKKPSRKQTKTDMTKKKEAKKPSRKQTKKVVSDHEKNQVLRDLLEDMSRSDELMFVAGFDDCIAGIIIRFGLEPTVCYDLDGEVDDGFPAPILCRIPVGKYKEEDHDLRKSLANQTGHDQLLFMNYFDDCIVGIVHMPGNDPIVCYDYDKVIDRNIEDGCTEEDAIEHFEYNQIGGWVGEYTPCFIQIPDNLENIIEEWIKTCK